MADQSTPGGASGSNPGNMANAANAAAQAAMANMAQASKMAETLFEQSTKASGAQSDAYIKMASMMDKIAKQQAEVVKINTELQAIEKKRLDLQKEMEKLGDKATDEQKKQLQQLREEVTLKKTAAIEAKKAANEQTALVEKMSKQQSVLGQMFSNGKGQMLQYLAGVATLSAALTNMAKATNDVLDISALSGNYTALQGGVTGLIKSAYSFQQGMAESRVGLRFLGYSADEVNASFKELSVTGAKVGGVLDTEGVAQLTTVTGRLSKMLGVSLPEATQYMITMQQRFGASTSATAQAMLAIYEATDKYNKEAGRTVIVGRDLTKVMFDLARESKGAAVDQKFLSQALTTNLLSLQAQGRNYQEALEQSSMYVKKMSTEAPDWTKILAGRELRKQLASAADITPAMTQQLEAARPGLTKRIKEILTSPVDEFTKQKLLQEALSGTQVGFESMEKGVSNLIDRLGDKANIALQQIHGMNATEADALIKQVKLNKDLAAEKERLYAMSEEARVKELMDTQHIDKAYAEYLSKQENAADLTDLLKQKQQDKSAAEIKANDETAKKQKEAQLAVLKAKRDQAAKFGQTSLADTYQKQINSMDAKSGLGDAESKTAKALEAVQGKKGGLRESLSHFYETYLKNPMWLTATSVALLAGKNLLELPKLLKSLPGDIKDLTSGFKGGKGGGGLSGFGAMSQEGKLAAGILGRSQGGKLAFTQGLRGAGAIGKLAKGSGVGAAAIEAGMGLYDTYNDYNAAETTEAKHTALAKGLTKTGGAAAGAGLGAWGGTAAGAAIGTMIFPGVGTVIGGLIGGAIGAYGGGKAGKAAAEAGYDMVSGSGVKNTPVSGLPESSQAAAYAAQNRNLPPGTSQAGAGGGSGGIQVDQSGQIIPGAQGFDYEITTTHRIPFAQLHAANMGVASKGVRSPTGGG